MLILQMKRSNPNFFAKKCRLNLTSGLICGILGEDGALAQLGARHIRIVEAVGSNPICSIQEALSEEGAFCLPNIVLAAWCMKKSLSFFCWFTE